MIALVGINHKTAPIEIREKFVFCETDILNFYKLFRNFNWFNGIVIISTCNRTEIYFEIVDNSDIDYIEKIIEILKDYRKFDNDLKKYLYTYKNKEAVTHLFRVCSGLDSMALGEYQIVNQLKTAFNISNENKLIGPELTRMFHKAFEASKKARTATKMNEGAISVSYAAVELVNKNFKDFSNHSVLSVGTGETGRLVVQNLKKKNCNNISIANRTFENTLVACKHFEASPLEFENIDNQLHNYDIVFISTASKKPIITELQVRKAMQKRNGKPIMLVDLSVPRNISSDVSKIENIKLFDVDDLQEIIQENYEKRKVKIVEAEKIISKIVDEYTNWLSSRVLFPTIQKISSNFKEVNKKEIDGFQKNKVKIDYAKAIEYGDHITNKYIRLLIKNIKSVTDNGKKTEMLELVNEIFELKKGL